LEKCPAAEVGLSMTKVSLLFILFAILNFAAFAQNSSAYNNVGFVISPGNATWLNSERLPPEQPAAAGKSFSTVDLEKQAFAEINDLRAKNGTPQLVWSDEVAKVARLHSNNMAEQKFFSHRGLDGSMVDDRADKFGLSEWREIGENIAFVRDVARPVDLAVEKWMESPAHRQNLLNKAWSESAIGIAIATDGTVYFTQVFLLRK
jgi:Uncharacterized protein with SCP/PR1 domains